MHIVKKIKTPGCIYLHMKSEGEFQTPVQGQTQAVQGQEQPVKGQVVAQLVVMSRAVLWSRKNGGEGILRLIGDATILLKNHVNEVIKVTILKRSGEPLLTFNGVNRLYRSQGRNYLVVHFPRRMMPMWEVIAKEVDDDGTVTLLLTLTGVKVKSRRRVKEG